MNVALPISQAGDSARASAQRERWQRRVRPLAQAGLPDGHLLVHEIYSSIQGEGSHVGLPCAFVRLTACHLRCSYCDTRQAFAHGRGMAQHDVVQQVQQMGTPLVLITGGEPMLQPGVLPLMATLCDSGLTVLLETSGSIPLDHVDPRVVRIIDMKTPSSGEVAANDYDILQTLRPHDEVKFVVGDRQDYEWACGIVQAQQLHNRCLVLVGPVWGVLPAKTLVEWVLHDRLPVRVQVQLHKYIWDPQTQGV